MNKKYFFFKKEDDARERFPRAKLIQAFVGIEGWLWTTKGNASKYKLPIAVKRR